MVLSVLDGSVKRHSFRVLGKHRTRVNLPFDLSPPMEQDGRSKFLFSSSVVTVLVSDDAEKREKLGKEYHLKSYTYDQFSQALADGECDAFYIATPNNLHRKFAVPALEKGSYPPQHLERRHLPSALV